MHSQRPRLLFISPRFLFPCDSGGKIRTTQVLKGMKSGAFRITLVSPAPPGATTTFKVELDGVCERFVSWPERRQEHSLSLSRAPHLFSRLPVSVASDRSAEGIGLIVEELRHHDIVVVDFLHAAALVPERLFMPSVLFTHNVETEIFRRHRSMTTNPLMRMMWRTQERKMADFERSAMARFTTIVAVSERDGETFRRDFGASRVRTIPTGVDLDFYAYRIPSPLPVAQEGSGGTLVFTGSMDWLANIDAINFFLDEAWQIIRQKRPNINFIVVGRNPPLSLIKRANEQNKSGIFFTGFVDDVRPPVYSAHVYIIPLRIGGGTRIKAYEAMAMGCPVVSTALGMEGLPIEPGRQCLIANDGKALADAILDLLANAEKRSRLSLAARDFVERQFSSVKAANAFECICLKALGKRV